MAEVVSVRDAVIRIRQDLSNMLATVHQLSRLQESLDRIGAGNPFTITPVTPKSILDPEVTDTGMAKVIDKANEKKDPITRELSCVTAVSHLKKALEDARRKRLKIESRIELGAGAEGEVSAAKALSLSMQEVEYAIGKKLRKALEMVLESRHKALEAVSKMDETVIAAFPDGAPELREVALKFSSADLITVLSMNEAMMTRGEKIATRKKVKI